MADANFERARPAERETFVLHFTADKGSADFTLADKLFAIAGEVNAGRRAGDYWTLARSP